MLEPIAGAGAGLAVFALGWLLGRRHPRGAGRIWYYEWHAARPGTTDTQATATPPGAELPGSAPGPGDG